MNPRAFKSLALATVVTVVAAIVAVVVQPTVSTVSVNNEPAFEDLRRAPDAVASAVIEARESRVAMHRLPDDTWVATDRDEYPVKSDQVRRLIAEMADMQLIERKTNRTERFKRLALEAVEEEDSTSRLVRLYDSGSNLLAEAIIGRRRQRTTGVQTEGTYIRKPQQAQAWLASGAVGIGGELADWLEDEVLNIFSKTVQQVEVNAVGGGAYTAYKDTPDVALKVISDLPEGKKVRDGSLSRLAAGLSNVDLVDVMPREDFVLPEEHLITTYHTFDGIEVRVELGEIDETGWATFAAQYLGTEGEVDAEAAAAAEALVEEVNARAGNWAYQLQDHVYSRLTVALADIIEDIPPEGAAGDDPAAMIPGMPQLGPPGGAQQQIPPEVLQQLLQQQLQQQQPQQAAPPVLPAPAP